VQLFAGEAAALVASFDLVVANLTQELLIQLGEELIRLGRRHLILSGITHDQLDRIQNRFNTIGQFETSDLFSENEWVCLHLSYATTVD
jgi:ribosomal protein L11 methylase PrmA